MWSFNNFSAFPVDIKNKDISFAKTLVTAIGGPAGELGAALRYYFQINTMPDKEGKALLTLIATEELGHVEILTKMMNQLLSGATIDELKEHGLSGNYAEHGYSFAPTDSNGVPFSTSYFATTGNPIADLNENLAAESKAKASYENLMRLTNEPSILAPLSFLRQREIIHYQRFAELLKKYQQKN